MTISSSTNKVLLNGDGSTTTFTFNFALLKSDYSDLYVYQIDVDEDTQEETQTLLTAGVDYNISVLKDTNLNILGGSITTTFVPTINQKIFIVREENLLQETKIEINQKFPERVIELTLDKLTLQNQQQQSLIDKCLKISQTSDAIISNFADTPVENMGVVWKKNNNGEFYLSNTQDNPDTIYNDIVNNPNVVAVSSNIDNINAVANNSTNIDAVAGNSTNINAVASNIANVNSVGANISNVNSVATNSTNINSVAGDLTNIDNVASDLNNIDIVANNLDIQRNLVIGELKHFARIDIPSGWLRCDGTQYTRASFSNFWDDYLTQNKIPTCSYADYATEISNNNGNCGKFAVDLVNLTFKVPTITGQVFISQALSSGDIGKFNSETLPNIKGSFEVSDRNNATSGAFYTTSGAASRGDANGNAGNYMNFNASYYSSVYQDGEIVQPNNIQYPIFVCVANIQVPVSEAQYNGFINNLTQKVDLDGSNATFDNLSSTAKTNLFKIVRPNYENLVVKNSGWTATENGLVCAFNNSLSNSLAQLFVNGIVVGYARGGGVIQDPTSMYAIVGVGDVITFTNMEQVFFIPFIN